MNNLQTQWLCALRMQRPTKIRDQLNDGRQMHKFSFPILFSNPRSDLTTLPTARMRVPLTRNALITQTERKHTSIIAYLGSSISTVCTLHCARTQTLHDPRPRSMLNAHVCVRLLAMQRDAIPRI